MFMSFEVRGTNRVRNQLRTAAATHTEISDPVIEVHCESERKRLKSKGYPPRNAAKQPFKSERQRRYFFWALNSGRISVPYARSGLLANKFAKVRLAPGRWQIENKRPGAAFVIKRGMQNKAVHAGRWWTMEDELEGGIGQLTKTLSQALEKAWG